MAIAEAETAQVERGAPVGLVYNGLQRFQSCTCTRADDLLAPQLRAGLLPFATPSWKRRALRTVGGQGKN